jgi:hypothetical protein
MSRAHRTAVPTCRDKSELEVPGTLATSPTLACEEVDRRECGLRRVRHRRGPADRYLKMSEEITAFPPGVAEKLKTYVYRLIDPRNGETFYVGKGTGNRVFAHIREEVGADAPTTKLRRIRDIHLAGFEVAHVIHRHGMDDRTAFEVEAALMDAYPGLTNMAGGLGNAEYGAMHAHEISGLPRVKGTSEMACLGRPGRMSTCPSPTRFRDCAHGSEPGCAVREALAGGAMSRERFAAWESLRKEAAAAALRADEHGRRAAERRFGRMVKNYKRFKGEAPDHPHRATM